MGILEDLFKNSTGLISGSAGDMAGETSMDVSYDPQQKFKDPYTTKDIKNPYFGNIKQAVPFTIDPKTGKRIVEGQPSTGMSTMAPPKKPNDLSSIANKDPGMFQRIFGIDTKTFAENWKNKGGYEGLMANPAFLLGLGIIQSSAQGKPIGSDIFDVAVKSGAISAQYADRLKERTGLLAPINESQRDEIRAVLEEQGITQPGMLDKLKNLFGNENAEAKYREALDMIYNRAEELARAESKRIGKKVRFDPRKYAKDAVSQLQKEGKLTVREDGLIISGTVQAKTQKIKGNREQGGPVESGETYIVGEKGAEMFVPEVDGNIINNDDSKVINMLLESNPQLKNVSRARAVKILKARFPDYF